MKARALIAGLAALGLAAATLRVFALEVTLPVETARLAESPLSGYALAVAHCQTCHSVDYVRMQPPAMSRTAWKASVVKMQKTFGAPIPDAAVDPISEYLAKTYGAERSPTPSGPASTTKSAAR